MRSGVEDTHRPGTAGDSCAQKDGLDLVTTHFDRRLHIDENNIEKYYPFTVPPKNPCEKGFPTLFEQS